MFLFASHADLRRRLQLLGQIEAEVKGLKAGTEVEANEESVRAFVGAELASASVSGGIIEAGVKGLKAGAGVEASEKSFRASAEAKLGSASVSVGGIIEAEAKVLDASAGVKVTHESVSAFVKAEVASASASAGPAKATIGLSAHTGVDISPTQVEAKLLGTGISIGRKMGVSLFGNSIEFNLW